ncbi:hypothetical protein CG51_16620 [Haematobacter missouriensis]|uniref:Uncharacterized protein n=1 Tax=Haematobacter missouriensis TaxID=366616 RepID=A0A212AYD7_9RHOB|nr:hypothetical protein [Haematobacter missouriensis]KFI33197.1 hypothetical protein CG51_16620 [Haematobacter missouriensis]OWJ78640.1 hypothetical protein CDV53_03015 [Haematobacter missouriensis]OWJ86480.1 hypothetical protein CDV52_00520 [Haematobacter missouriensis]
MRNPIPGNGPGLPAAALHEIHDCLALALDATESRHPLPQPIREARSYMRTALRHTRNLMNGGGMVTHSEEARS